MIGKLITAAVLVVVGAGLMYYGLSHHIVKTANGRVYVPKDAKKGDDIHVNLVKRSVKTKKVMGGIAMTIHVV